MLNAMEMSTRPTQPPTAARPRAEAALRTIRRLALGYLGLSVIALGAVALLRDHPDQVNSAVWTRTIIVVISAVLTLSFAGRAARGAPRAYLRLRIISLVMPAAIAVLIALPGLFPVWVRIEQAVCGLLLLAIARLANCAAVRAAFGK